MPGRTTITIGIITTTIIITITTIIAKQRLRAARRGRPLKHQEPAAMHSF
jgi:hypothetical protein